MAGDLAQNENIKKLITNLLQADADRNLKKLSTFYMPLIKYNGEVASKDDFLSETQAFYKTWPIAKWKMIDDPIIKTDINNMHTVKYKAAFRLENESKGIYSEGILTSSLLIVTTTEGKLRIQTVGNEVNNSKKGSISRNLEIDSDGRVENQSRSSRPLNEILFDSNNNTRTTQARPNLQGQSPNVQKAYNNAFNTIDEMIKIASSPEYMEEWNRIKGQAYYHYINKGLTPKEAERAAEEYAGGELAKKHW